jgi:solute carrier family 25 phosphate transporter 23/24/25/41
MSDPNLIEFTKQLKEEFDLFDSDKSGTISLEEFQTAMHKLHITESNQNDFLDKIDADRSKTISWEEFQAFGIKRYYKLKTLFDKFDENHDGKISKEEFKKILRYLKVDVKLGPLFKKFDKNGDGFIDFMEWKSLLFFVPRIKDIQTTFSNMRDYVALDDLFDDTAIRDVQIATSENVNVSSFAKSAFAGGFSAAVSKTCIAPLERIKILKQVAKGDAQSGAIFLLQDIWRKQGIRGLFKGNFTHLLKSAPEKALKFGLYDTMKDFLMVTTKKEELKNSEIFLAASSSSACTVVILHPMEVIRTQLSVSTENISIIQVIKNLSAMKEPGFGGAFYRGLIPHLLSTVPNSGVNLMSYEALKSMFFGKNPEKEPSMIGLVGVGAGSSVVSSSVFYPFHLLKSRLIVRTDPGDTFVSITRGIFKEAGIKGLFRGFPIALIKSVPAHGISFGVYEFMKRTLGVQEKHKHSKIHVK